MCVRTDRISKLKPNIEYANYGADNIPIYVPINADDSDIFKLHSNIYEWDNLLKNKITDYKNINFIDINKLYCHIDNMLDNIQGGFSYRSKMFMISLNIVVKDRFDRAICIYDYLQKKIKHNCGYTYIIKGKSNNSDKTLYKIGKANDLNVRMSRFEVKIPFKISPFVSFYSSTPQELESLLHKEFKHKRKAGEWFDLDNSDINKILLIGQRYEADDYYKLRDIDDLKIKKAKWKPDKEYIEYLETILVFNNVDFEARI